MDLEDVFKRPKCKVTANKLNQISEIVNNKVLDVMPSYMTNRYGTDYKRVISGETGLLTMRNKKFLEGKDQVNDCIL